MTALLLKAPLQARGWHLGQQLDAVVIGPGRRDTHLLSIEQRQIEVHARVPLQPGRKLSLEVAQLTPTINLRVVPKGISGASPVEASLIRNIVRNLPSHASLAETRSSFNQLRNLAANTQDNGASSARDPNNSPAIRTLIERLVTRLPEVRHLTSTGAIAEKVKSGAVAPERLLATTHLNTTGVPPEQKPASSDWRVILRQLSIAMTRAREDGRAGQVPLKEPQVSQPRPFAPQEPLQPSFKHPRGVEPTTSSPTNTNASLAKSLAGATATSNEVSKLVDQVIKSLDAAAARAQLNQTGNVLAQSNNALPTVVEFPVALHDQTDFWHFEIFGQGKHEQSRDGDGDAARMVFSLQVSDEVAFNCEINLRGERVHINVGSNHATFHQLIGEHLERLRTALRNSQIDLATLQLAEVHPSETGRHLPANLLDERA